MTGADVRPARDGAVEVLQSLTGYRADPVAFARAALTSEVWAMQAAALRRVMSGGQLVHDILNRRVAACIDARAHTGGRCAACGVHRLFS